ncbi:MAG: dihydropteridine reductase, partial [Clostridia bacterium]|nr:dihydropteridine reductase [Clostridia bacterium]
MNRNNQQFIAQKIRTQYMEQQPSELDELRRLDAEVKRPANVFAYVFGSISAIIMGAGMSLTMTEIGANLGIGSPMVVGIIVGVL